MSRTNKSSGRYASSPCMAGEIAPDYFDPSAVDPEQTRDVARWRKSERTRLRRLRNDLTVVERNTWSKALMKNIRSILADRLECRSGQTLSAYWPINGEADLRSLMGELHAAGIIVALPVVETRAAPLIFRRWTPGTRLIRGVWNIPVPAPDAESVVPQIALAPTLGWDGNCYRLGYGGGYFDRTLGVLSPRPFTIGIGLQAARLATIYPQPHDVALNAILTEDGLQSTREAP